MKFRLGSAPQAYGNIPRALHGQYRGRIMARIEPIRLTWPESRLVGVVCDHWRKSSPSFGNPVHPGSGVGGTAH